MSVPAHVNGQPDQTAGGHGLVYLKLVAVALLWGGTFIAGQKVAHQLPPLLAAVGRFAIACAVLVPLALHSQGGLPRLHWRLALSTLGLGLSGVFVYNLCFFSALARLPAGRTALFVALNPVGTALLARLFTQDQLSGQRWLGIVIALLGTVIVVTRGDLVSALGYQQSALGLGEMFISIAVLAWSAYTLLGRRVLLELTPLAATTYACCWGLALLLPCAIFAQHGVWPDVSWQALPGLAYLGVGGTVLGFVWYYQGVHAIGAARAAIFTNLVPVFGVLLASTLLGEKILVSMLTGGALVLLGVWLTNRAPRPHD